MSDLWIPEQFQLDACLITLEEYNILLRDFKERCTCWVEGCGIQSEGPDFDVSRNANGTIVGVIHWDTPDYVGSVHKCSNNNCDRYVCRKHQMMKHTMGQSYTACSEECDRKLYHPEVRHTNIIW